MLPLVLPLLLGILHGAQSLGPYSFEPADIRTPEWTDPLVDSLRTDRPTGFQALVHGPDGSLIGRDTLELRLEGSTIYDRKVQWAYGTDTTCSISETWRRGIDAPVDSLRKQSCTRDSCVVGIAQWAISSQDGERFVLGYFEGSKPWYDTLLFRADAKGRTIYQHVWHSSNTGYTIDSILWGDEAPIRWRRDWRNAGTVSIESHHPTWSGTRLVRDSVSLRTTPDGGSAKDSVYVRTCSWDGARFLDCVVLPDSTMESFMEWNTQGKPTFQFTNGHPTAWEWDAQGRVTRERNWGTETDLDSLVYGSGILPERSLIFDCKGEAPGSPDSCTLRKTRVFSYSIPNPAGASIRTSSRVAIQRSPDGTLRFGGLEERAIRVVLADPSGRILTSSAVQGGSCELATRELRGLALWIVLGARGRRIASGAIPTL